MGLFYILCFLSKENYIFCFPVCSFEWKQKLVKFGSFIFYIIVVLIIECHILEIVNGIHVQQYISLVTIFALTGLCFLQKPLPCFQFKVCSSMFSGHFCKIAIRSIDLCIVVSCIKKRRQHSVFVNNQSENRLVCYSADKLYFELVRIEIRETVAKYKTTKTYRISIYYCLRIVAN